MQRHSMQHESILMRYRSDLSRCPVEKRRRAREAATRAPRNEKEIERLSARFFCASLSSPSTSWPTGKINGPRQLGSGKRNRVSREISFDAPHNARLLKTLGTASLSQKKKTCISILSSSCACPPARRGPRKAFYTRASVSTFARVRT